MTLNALGDMARAFALQHQNSLLKREIQQYNQELSSGISSSLSQHLGGSYARLTSIERDIRLQDSYSITISEADNFTELMQARLEQIGDISSEFARSLIAQDASNSFVTTTALTEEARLQFSTVVSMLNSSNAGRSLFSGDATDTNALVDAETFLAELETVVSGATSAADVETALDAWFASPTGFDTFAYSGSTTNIAPFKMSETAQVGVDVRADAQEIKDVLKGLAMGAMAQAPTTALPLLEIGDLFRMSGEALLSAESAIVGVQSKVGLAQEQIANWSVRNQTELAGFEYAKGALLAIDPYETASKLEAAQFQLESLYTVTVRLSQLSLVNYLR